MRLGIGLFVVIASILIGYTMHHGHIAVLLQRAEFVIIGGCAVGACIVGNTGPVIKGSIARLLGLLKPNPFVLANHHAVDFFTDTLKSLSSGAINKMGDAMPGFGIVAAVLGVVITMQSIGGSAAEIGEKVAAALVGTFLGILLAYGIIGPMASAIESRIESEHAYLLCIRSALLAFARGDAPKQTAQAARRSLQSEGVAAERIASVRGMADRVPKIQDFPRDPRNRRISILLPFRHGDRPVHRYTVTVPVAFSP